MKRPIKVYLSAHSEDVASASRVASLVLSELGCEVLADYTPVEKGKECRSNRRRVLQKCQVFLQLVGRDAGPILVPEHQHDSLCSVAVWEAGEASALQKSVVRMLLADDFPFDESKPGTNDREVSRFQTMHRHRLLSHQRKVLPVEDYEDLLQRIGRMWGGSFARQHGLPELGLDAESIDRVCERVSARLFEKSEVPGGSSSVVHEEVQTSLPEVRIFPVNRAPISVPSPSDNQIVARPVGLVVPRSPVSDGNVIASKAPEQGNSELTPPASAPIVLETPLQSAEDPNQCPADASSQQRTQTHGLEGDSCLEPRSLPEESDPIHLAESVVAREVPASFPCPTSEAPATSSELLFITKSLRGEAVPAETPLVRPLSDSLPLGTSHQDAKVHASVNGSIEVPLPIVEAKPSTPSTSPFLPAASSGNPIARMPVLSLSAPAMVIAAGRHALFLSLLDQSATGLGPAVGATDVSSPESIKRLGRGSEAMLQAPMKLEFSRPKLHIPPPVPGSSPQVWRVPFRRSLASVETEPLSAPAGSIVGTLKFPGDALRNSLSPDANRSRAADVSLKKCRSLYSKEIRITLTLVGGLFAWALALLLHAGWQYFTQHRTTAKPASQFAASSTSKQSKASPSTDDSSEKMVAPPSVSVASNASDGKPTVTGAEAPSSVSTPGPASAESDVFEPPTLEEQQHVLECQLEAAIVKMRENSRDATAYAGDQERLIQDILPQFQELAPKIANRGSPRTPEALAMSRHLASIHILCGHRQSALNVLMDMRESIVKTHANSDAEVRLLDYLVELTDNYTPSSPQGSTTPQFPMTPGETQHLLDMLHSRPEWMPAAAGAAIAGSNSSTK